MMKNWYQITSIWNQALFISYVTFSNLFNFKSQFSNSKLSKIIVYCNNDEMR